MIDKGYLPAISSSISYCPSWREGKGTIRYSYGMRASSLSSYGTVYYRINRSQTIKVSGTYKTVGPSEFILYADSTNGSSQWYRMYDDNVPDGYDGNDIHLRHFQRANAAFADGHVKSVGVSEVEELGFKSIHYTVKRLLQNRESEKIEEGKKNKRR